MYVLPDPKKKSKRKTKTVKCSLVPKWGESFVWQLASSIDLKVSAIFSVALPQVLTLVVMPGLVHWN